MREIDIERLKVDAEYWDEVAPTHCDKAGIAYVNGKYWSHEFLSSTVTMSAPCNAEVRFISRPTNQAQEIGPYTLSDDHPIRRISELGNQLHNLGCELQNNEDLSDELGQIACCLWDIVKREQARTKQQRQREELAALCDEYITRDDYGHNLADAVIEFYEERYNLKPKQ